MVSIFKFVDFSNTTLLCVYWNRHQKNFDVCLIFFQELSPLFGESYADIPVISLPQSSNEMANSECYAQYPAKSFGVPSRDPSVSCDGGDGNPLICPTENGAILAGMASCSTAMIPDFYTNIAKLNLREWIDWSIKYYIKWISKCFLTVFSWTLNKWWKRWFCPEVIYIKFEIIF